MRFLFLFTSIFVLSSGSFVYGESVSKKKVLFEATLHYSVAEKYELYEQGNEGYLVSYEKGKKKDQKVFTAQYIREYYQKRVHPFFEAVRSHSQTEFSCSVKASTSWREQGEMQKRSFCLGSKVGNQISPLIRAVSFEVLQK